MAGSEETPADRVAMSLALFELAVSMLRQRCVREGKSPAETEAAIDTWISTRPGAEDGDAEGRLVEWPRR